MARGSITPYDGPRGRSYRVVVDAGKRPDGSRHQIRRAFPTKRAAERFLAATLAAIDARKYGEPSKEPLGAYLDRWLASIATSGVKPATEYRYRLVCRLRFAELRAVRLCDLTTAAIEDQYASLARSLARSTIAQAHAVLSGALEDAVRRGELPRNPAAGAALPRGRRFKPTVWTAAQARRFRDAAADDLYGVYWRVALETMARPGELTPLRWEALDLRAGTLTIAETRTADVAGKAALGSPKSESGERTIELSAELAKLLRRYREAQRKRQAADPSWNACGYLFPNRVGGAVNAGQIGKRLHRAAAALGLPKIRPHDLRHTGATLAIADGVPLKVVSERLGHADVRTTFRYVHPDRAAHRKAAEQIARIYAPETTKKRSPKRASDRVVTRCPRTLPKNRTVKPKKRV